MPNHRNGFQLTPTAPKFAKWEEAAAAMGLTTQAWAQRVLDTAAEHTLQQHEGRRTVNTESTQPQPRFR